MGSRLMDAGTITIISGVVLFTIGYIIKTTS
jgi:hypothetical protein